MPEETQADYFAERELIEREMGRRATDARVAAAHVELAERYEALAIVFGATRRTSFPTT